MVIDDKLANPQATENIYTVKKAYEHLLTADSTHFNREVLRQCALNEYITPNLTFDEERTQAAKEEILNNYSWANGLVVSGQKIIDRGEIVSPHTYNILESLRKESIKRNESMGQNRLILGGQVLFVGMLMLCFMLYLDLFRKDYYQRKGSLSLLFTLIVFYSVITAFMVTHNIFNVYIIPYAMLPIIIRVFLDSRTAFLTHVITILICSISLRFPHEFILTQLAAGLVAIFSLRELSQRSQLFRTALLVILTYAAIYFAFELMTENGLSTDFSKLNIRMYTYFIINGILLLFTYPYYSYWKRLSDLLPMLLWWNFRISITIFCGRCLKRFPEPSNIPCRWLIWQRKPLSALEQKPVSTYGGFVSRYREDGKSGFLYGESVGRG